MIYHRATFVLFTAILLICRPSSSAQESGRTKVAEGEYKVTTEGDLGVGPIETEIFHFSESWTLWRTGDGYDLEGQRDYESPQGQPHHDEFVAKVSRDLQPLSTKVFRKLVFRRDSGPLTCEFIPQRLHCDSGAKDPANRVDVQYSMDHPYAPISFFPGGSHASCHHRGHTGYSPSCAARGDRRQPSDARHPLRWSDSLSRAEPDDFRRVGSKLAPEGL